MSSISSYTFPVSGHASRRLNQGDRRFRTPEYSGDLHAGAPGLEDSPNFLQSAGPPPIESRAPISYDYVWQSAVFFVPLTIIVAIVAYLISTM